MLLPLLLWRRGSGRGGRFPTPTRIFSQLLTHYQFDHISLFSFASVYTLPARRMKLGIINSAFYQAGVNTASGLKHISRIGFDCVDVHTEAVDLPKEEIRLVADTCEQLGLPIISLPVCSLGLADFAAPVREFHID